MNKHRLTLSEEQQKVWERLSTPHRELLGGFRKGELVVIMARSEREIENQTVFGGLQIKKMR